MTTVAQDGHSAIEPPRRVPLVVLDVGVLLPVMVAAVYGRLFDSTFLPGLGVSYGQALVIGVVAILLVQAYLGEPVGDYQTGLVVIGMFCALGLVSLVHADDSDAVWAELTGMVQNSFVFFAILLGVTTPRRLRGVIWALIAAAGIVAAVNLWQLATGTYDNQYRGLATGNLEVIVGEEFGQRIAGPGLGPNGLALMLTFCLPLAFDRWTNDRVRALRWLAGGVTALLVVGTIFTYSRNGFLTMVLIGALIARHRRIPWRRVLAVVALLAALVTVAAPDYVARLSTLVELASGQVGSEQSLSTGRTSEYLVGVEMYREHPVLGVGLGNYPSRYLEYSTELGLDTRRENRAPHSMYLQFAAELGAIGVAWLVSVVAWAMIGLRRAKQRLLTMFELEGVEMLAAIEIAFVAFLWFSLFRHVALQRYLLIPLALALAAPGALGASTVPRGAWSLRSTPPERGARGDSDVVGSSATNRGGVTGRRLR